MLVWSDKEKIQWNQTKGTLRRQFQKTLSTNVEQEEYVSGHGPTFLLCLRYDTPRPPYLLVNKTSGLENRVERETEGYTETGSGKFRL